MMGRQTRDQGQLGYLFNLERRIPADHLLRRIDPVVISTRYEPGFADGIRYDDPALGIEWPLPITEISEQDLHWPRFADSVL